jgi:hypothetical protein
MEHYLVELDGDQIELLKGMVREAMKVADEKKIAELEGLISASLIGRLGSSAFRLSTSTVSMSLTGSCFSSESAPRPFHHGIRRRGGTIFGTALPSV